MDIDFIDREAYLEHNLEVLNVLLLQPGTVRDLLIGIGVAIVAIAFALTKTHAVGGSSRASLITGLFVASVGTFALIEIYAITELSLIPFFEWENYSFEIICGALVVSFFIMVVPFTRMLFRAAYWTSVGAWIMSCMLAGLILLCTSMLYEDKKKGRTPIDIFKKTTETIETISPAP